MLFNSYQFLIFFPLVTLAYFLLPPKFLKLNEAVTIKIKNLWLLICSYYFYMCWNAKYVILLMTATGITFLGGLAISKIQKTTGKKAILALCIASNMFILFFYKYANFVIELLNGLLSSINFELSVRQFDVLLPVGISFYTFQALSYVIDVYRDEVKVEKNFFTYALFVSFFPQLVAGPIERSKNLLTQFSSNKGYMCLHEFEGTRVTKGLQLMLYGFFEKLVVADRLSIIVTNVYSDYTNFAGIQIVLATVMFAFQIYCDFSGYSHIAIGASEILGFKLMKNFRQPYFAVSVTDFWHRWHVSLTTWFKDYLYIPLGGNRKGKIRKYCNILAVFFASGLWHGANVTFIVWGVLNGIFQIAEDILHVNTKGRINPIIRAFKICFTFLLVDFTWLFFRAENMEHAIGLIRRITGQFFCNIEFSFPGAINLMRDMGANTSRTVWIIFAIVILLLIDYLHEKDISISASIQTLPSFARWSIYLVACEVLIYNWICNFGVAAEQFIYFQF